MFGIDIQGGWRADPENLEYAQSVFASADELLDFYDILTKDQWSYASRHQAGERVLLQQHVTSSSGPVDFDNIMNHARHVEATAGDIMNFALLRLALDSNSQLRGITENQENWWGLRTLPYSFFRPLASTVRAATPFMLTRIYARGIPVEYVARVPFFNEQDYIRVYEMGVAPDYIRQFMVPPPGAPFEHSWHIFLAPIDTILLGWKNGIPADYLKETVTSCP